MQEYFAGPIFKYLNDLGAWEMRAASTDRKHTGQPDYVVTICAKLGVLQGLAEAYEFKSIVSQCQRIIKNCQDSGMNVSAGEMRDDLRELRRRSEDEIRGHFFLHLRSAEAEQYKDPLKGWEDIASRFPKIRFNIEESGKCHALGRFGASVFHILQVAEYGVIQVAELFGEPGDKPGWGSLKRLQKLQSTPYNQRQGLALTHSKLLDNVVPLSVVVKDSWRHKLDHVDNQIVWVDTDFGSEVADEIIKATRGFMRKLAVELPR